MGRFVNLFLIGTGAASAVALGVDTFTPHDFITSDGVAFMCILIAVPLVLAAIRIQTASIKSALNSAFAAHAERMEAATAQHAERVCKNTMERVLQALARGQMEARLDKDEMHWHADTGPFRIPR